ncbi:MAG: hypothetical protein R3321_03375 [Nitrososphaeraceae archaeon]|nr:hypothetical protein [Nitrososphaeraceae archaeon]
MINLKKFNIEAERQSELLTTIITEGYVAVDESNPLNGLVGTVQTFEVFYECLTEKLLCKIFIKDMEGYHFIPLWQIIKYCGQEVLKDGKLPKKGEIFSLTVIVGPRRILATKQWVPALRLPQK